MKTIYYSRTVSGRNMQHGYFEEEDFGEIKIVQLSEEKAPLFLRITDYQKKEVLRTMGNKYLSNEIYLPFSREEDALWMKKQGHWTEKTAVLLGIAVRKRCDSFYPAENKTFYLIGKTLYRVLCEKSELEITQCGNMLFGSWWSIDIEPN